MRLTALLAILLLSSLALAGCSDDKDGDGDETSSSTSSTSRSSTSATSTTSASSSSTTSSSSSTSTGPSNRAPTGSLAASVATGGAPVAVNFTLSGSDPDGDVLVWDLAFGDGNATNGTSLPKTVQHTYTKAGNFTAALAITDGKATTAYNVTVQVTAGAAAPTGLTFAGSVQAPCLQCTVVLAELAGSPLPLVPVPSVSWNTDEQGIDMIFTPIGAELVGHAFVATSSATDVAVGAFTECGPAGVILQVFDDETTPEPGVVPEGTGCMALWEFPPVPGAPSGGDLTLVIS